MLSQPPPTAPARAPHPTPARAPAFPVRGADLDALRLYAALAVLGSHAFALAGGEQPSIGTFDVGTVGVLVFFGLSGFLITGSWAADPHAGRFLLRRALRILPALVVVLLLTALALGPLVTSLPAGEYLLDPGTWRYVGANALLVTSGELPGVFTGNPYPGQVNGSLWTLQPEAVAYAAVAVAGVLGALRVRWVAPVAALLLIAWTRLPGDPVPWPRGILLFQAFAVGATLYQYRREIPWRGDLAAGMAVAFVVVPWPTVQALVAVVAVPYAALYLGFHGRGLLARTVPRADYSYGVYIYAWPVGQAVASVVPHPAAVIAFGLPVTVALAALSWHLVERPALRLKPARPAPATAGGHPG